MLLLAGCGDFGLTSTVLPREGAITDSGVIGDELEEEEDEEERETDPERVVVPLESETWAVDLEEVTWAAPPGIESLLGLLDATVVLFHAVDESSDRLSFVVAMAGSDGRQDPCERVVSLPAAEWTNPVFTLQEGTLALTVGGGPLDVRSALLSATVSADGETWTDGVLDGIVDAREVEAGLGDGWDVCQIIDDMGGSCTACDDGAPKCFELRIEEIRATQLDSAFDPYVDDGAC